MLEYSAASASRMKSNPGIGHRAGQTNRLEGLGVGDRPGRDVLGHLDLPARGVKGIVFDLQRRIEIVGRREEEGAADREILVLRAILAEIGGRDETATVRSADRNAAGQVVRQRPGHVSIQRRVLGVEHVGQVDPGLELGRRAGGDQAERAAGRVLAEQHRLGTTQHFHPFEIEEGRARQPGPAIADAVYELGHGLFEGRVVPRADAADIHLGADTRLGHLEIGHRELEIVQLCDLEIIEGFTRDNGNRDRNFGDGLLTLLRRHGDHVELLRERGNTAQSRRQSGRRHSGHQTGCLHVSLPFVAAASLPFSPPLTRL